MCNFLLPNSTEFISCFFILLFFKIKKEKRKHNQTSAPLIISQSLLTGKHLTIGKVAVGARMNSVTERELYLLIAREVESMGRPRPHCQYIHASDRPPHALSLYNLPQGIHHVPVACARLWVQALHASLR